MNITTGLWKCFSRCGAGDFTRLVEQKMGYSRQEALHWIESNGTGNSANVLAGQLEKIFHPVVASGIPGMDVNNDWLREYNFFNRNVMPMWLLDRGFTWETINHWQMVYNPGGEAVIIPIFWEGELVGTVKRNHDREPKYENSAGLPVERIFFGEISRDRRDIILVEGILDAIWLWQLGYHAVSILGSSLTKQQLAVLRRYRFGEITLAFDNDDAGRRATNNALTSLMGAGWLHPQVNIIRFPGKKKGDPGYRKDPQECSDTEFGQLYLDRKGPLAV